MGSSDEGEGERYVDGFPRMQEGASAQVDGVEWLWEGLGWVPEVNLGWEWFLGGGRPAEGDVVEENVQGWLLLQMDPPKTMSGPPIGAPQTQGVARRCSHV